MATHDKTNTEKRKLTSLTAKEMRVEYRKMRDARNALRDRNIKLVEDNEYLEASCLSLKEQLSAMATDMENLNNASAELQLMYDRASDNNTALRAMVDSIRNGQQSTQASDGESEITKRLDTIIHLVRQVMGLPTENEFDRIIFAAEETDEDEDDTEDDEDSEDDEDGPVMLNVDEDDDTEEEDDDSQTEEETENTDSADEQESETIHGATAEIPTDNGPNKLTALVVPQITAFITLLGSEEADSQIIKPIRSGAITKELALRNVIAAVFPSQGTEMASAILESDETREAAYKAMGV